MLRRCSYFEIKGIKKEYEEQEKDYPTFYCVALSHPRWWKGKCFSPLAPSATLLSLVKKGKVLWEEYRLNYLAEITSDRSAYEVLKAIWKQAQQEDVFLVCWEKTVENTECHTIILLDLIDQLSTKERWYY